MVLAALLLCSTARADYADTFSAAEKEVLEQVGQGKFIKARDLAEKVLTQSPRSFPATWAMAKVQLEEEGNHARALAWIRRANELLGDADKEWGMKVMLEEHFILAEMNRNVEALQQLDRFEEKYGPAPAYLRVWPMFKSGRSEEARVIAARLAASEDDADRAEGYNGLLSIAFEERDRAGTYKWSMAGVEATGGKNCTILRNASSAAYIRFKLDQAEEFSNRARKLKDCIDPVDNQIASLSIIMGQFQQAVAALESSRSTYIEKRYRPHFALERRGVLVDLLEAVGQPEEALKLATELYGQQQRMGVSSGAPEMERLTRTLRYLHALDGRIAQLGEQLSYAPRPGPASIAAELARVVTIRWEIRRALVQLLSGDDRLLMMTRPMLADPSDWANWRTGDLIGIVGTGVMRASISRARVLDAAFPEATGPLDSLEGEVAFQERSWADAVKLGTSALAGLNKREALWRWRIMAWRADALRRLGRMNEARADYQEVLQRWPTAFRMLDLAVPVKISNDGSALAKETATRLGRSPRLDVEDKAPFQITVTGSKTIDICLLDDNGSQLACASGEGADKALDAFHSAAFSPKVSLTQSDLKSLDGSPVRVGADQAMKKLLGK